MPVYVCVCLPDPPPPPHGLVLYNMNVGLQSVYSVSSGSEQGLV